VVPFISCRTRQPMSWSTSAVTPSGCSWVRITDSRKQYGDTEEGRDVADGFVCAFAWRDTERRGAGVLRLLAGLRLGRAAGQCRPGEPASNGRLGFAFQCGGDPRT